MAFNIKEEKNGNSIISASDNTVFIKGEIDDPEPGVYLTPFFNKIISIMEESITLDLCALEFLNSSGIKCLVSFIVNRKADSTVLIKTDKSKAWQRSSLEIIQLLDEKNIQIESI